MKKVMGKFNFSNTELDINDITSIYTTSRIISRTIMNNTTYSSSGSGADFSGSNYSSGSGSGGGFSSGGGGGGGGGGSRF